MYNIPNSIINRRPLETTVVSILLLLDELSTDDTFFLLLRSSDCGCVDLRCPFSIGLRILLILLLLLLLLSFDDFYVINIVWSCVSCKFSVHRINADAHKLPPSSLTLLTEGDVLRRNSGIFPCIITIMTTTISWRTTCTLNFLQSLSYRDREMQ